MTKVGAGVTGMAVDHPFLLTGLVVLVSAALIVLAGAPSLWPDALPFIHAVKVDKHDIGQLILRVIGQADFGGVAIHQNPFIVFGIFQIVGGLPASH